MYRIDHNTTVVVVVDVRYLHTQYILFYSIPDALYADEIKAGAELF